VFPSGSVEEKQVTDLWKKTPVIPAEKYAATVQLLKFFAKQLSGMSNQIAIEETNAESPVITRARQYIAEHKTEGLSLAAVAKVAGSSVFHFCKTFHKSTGLNFTDYVARARVEDAKKGLLNPNRRISEIAYDVGFQSLTQFNRTFKKIFGQSPSEYRTQLSTGGIAMAA
jgi:AraC-like DNA-binding protein